MTSSDKNAEYVRLSRGNVDVLIRLIDDRWTPAETVLKRLKDVLWQAKRTADAEVQGAIICENCGKAMREHGIKAECWPELTDGYVRSEEST